MQLFCLCFHFEFKIARLVSGALSGLDGDSVLQMFDGSSPLVAQMYKQNVAEFATSTATQCVQDGLVFAHGFPPPLALAGKIGGVADATNAAGEVGVSASQRCVARGFDDLVMDQLIDAEIAMHVAVQV